MKLFKQIDLLISIVLIAGFGVYFIYDQAILFKAYFIIGGWQVLSMLIHALSGWFTGKDNPRRTYHWISFIVIAMGALVPLLYVFAFIFVIMLFAAPLMAIIYSVICYNELKSLNTRPSDIF